MMLAGVLHGKVALALFSAAAVLGTVGALLFVAAIGGAASNTWTTTADFDLGTYQGTNATDVADQVQLSATGATFPLLWIANAGEDTLSKFDTNANKEVGRYRTYFDVGLHGAWSGPAPSRTAVDGNGNVYVLNRHFDGLRPHLLKILATGGIDRNGNSVIDTSSDLNNDGIIQFGSAEMKPLTDLNLNGVLDNADLQDERVEWVAQVANANDIGRSLCIAADGNLWVGTWNGVSYYKVDASNGATLLGPISNGMSNYGCAIDGNGQLWSASLGSLLGQVDTGTLATVVRAHPACWDYGIAVGNSKVYQSDACWTWTEFDPNTNTFANPACLVWGICVGTTAVSVAGDGKVYVSEWSGALRKFNPDGSQIWFSPAQPGISDVRGALIDSNGDVWMNHVGSNNLSKFRGTDGAHLGVFPAGLHPYTYSDATGQGFLSQVNQTGFWTVVYDGGAAGTQWGTVSWNDLVPAGGTLEVRVRAADTVAGLDFQNYMLVSNGGQFALSGRYIQIQVKFVASPSDQSPILYDLTVEDIQQVPPTPTPVPPPLVGRMTGGGTIGAGGPRHGFELHCDAAATPQRLEVNWGKGNKFHLENLTSAVCSNDPTIGPEPPAAGFDTYTGTGTGRYNGVSGATIEFTFTDAGEPGKNDYATVKIKDAGGNVVLQASGNLSSGNQQAHAN